MGKTWRLAALIGVGGALACAGEPAAQTCGQGTWRPGSLEIHHFALGQADATLVVAPGGQSLLVDLGEEEAAGSAGATRVGQRLQAILGCRRVDHVLLTHFHLDHVGAVGRGGLWHLVERQGFQVGATWHRDLWRQRGEDGAILRGWAAHLAGPGGRRLNARLLERGGPLPDLGPLVQLRLVAGDGQGVLLPGDHRHARDAPSENDYSLALVLRWRRLDYFFGGDLSGTFREGRAGRASYHDAETLAARLAGDVDVYRADHHGSAFASNPTLLGQLDPEVSVVSMGPDNRHRHPHPETLVRLRATGAVYLTGGDPGSDPGGDVLVRSEDGWGYAISRPGLQDLDGAASEHRYLARDPARVDADGDGFFLEVDPDDRDPGRSPAPFGGCDPRFQPCRQGSAGP